MAKSTCDPEDRLQHILYDTLLLAMGIRAQKAQLPADQRNSMFQLTELGRASATRQ